jgi:hypothetical protein
MKDDNPIYICCPYCLSWLGTIPAPDVAFDPPTSCRRCGGDPRRDAPFEMRFSAWVDLTRVPCAACGEPVPTLATRCMRCGGSAPADGDEVEPAALRPVATIEDFALTDVRDQCGAHALGRCPEGLVVYDLRLPGAAAPRVLEIDWSCSAALARDGRVAAAARTDVLLAAPGSCEFRSIGTPPHFEAIRVGFVDDVLWAFPSPTEESDIDGDGDDLRPWTWDGAWAPVRTLPRGRGWMSKSGFGWNLDGLAVGSPGGPAYVIWDSRVYRREAHGFVDLGTSGLTYSPSDRPAERFRDGLLLLGRPIPGGKDAGLSLYYVADGGAAPLAPELGTIIRLGAGEMAPCSCSGRTA